MSIIGEMLPFAVSWVESFVTRQEDTMTAKKKTSKPNRQTTSGTANQTAPNTTTNKGAPATTQDKTAPMPTPDKTAPGPVGKAASTDAVEVVLRVRPAVRDQFSALSVIHRLSAEQMFVAWVTAEAGSLEPEYGSPLRKLQGR